MSARLLDLGFGCGIPVAKTLADHGHQVTGIHLGEVQINRARRRFGQCRRYRGILEHARSALDTRPR
jgi:2-polyprenyl-3-methyl-5-hydroxy-6-metoxy-1,4-benzoquinol methylase